MQYEMLKYISAAQYSVERIQNLLAAMSFPAVLERGDDFLNEYPRSSMLWKYASHFTCLFVLSFSKIALNTLYNPHVHHLDRLDEALARAKKEKRSLLTIMNHMSVVDDPSLFAALPIRYWKNIDTIRWGFGAANICFSDSFKSWFFNLGQVLGTERFGVGPFQASLDAAVRILSPDGTTDIDFAPIEASKKPLLLQDINYLTKGSSIAKSVDKSKNLMATSPFIRTETSWFHVFPEGFVLQLHPPHNNSMRYFRWGVSRLILESTRAPVVLPIFSYGFEKIAPEDTANLGIKRWLPANLGAEVHIHIGEEFDSTLVEEYREKWRNLCARYPNDANPCDMSDEVKFGREAQDLRSSLAALLRQSVLDIRTSTGKFALEDPRFKDPSWWKEYTKSEGKSDPEVKFIGENWAIKRLQKNLPKGISED